MKIHAEFKQKNGGDPTLEWNLIRVGRVTASQADQLVSPTGEIRKGLGVESYLCQKLAERWIGGSLPSAFTGSFATEQGNLVEEQAIPFAEFEYGLKIQQVGFVSTESNFAGCSPDGLIGFENLSKTAPTPYEVKGNESGFEIKCPALETHIKYLLKGEVPKDYIAQLQFGMFVTGCKTWHFLSYRRNMPALHLIVEQDLKYQAALEQALDEFRSRFDLAMAKLIDINGGEPNPKQRGAVPFRIQEVASETFDLIP